MSTHRLDSAIADEEELESVAAPEAAGARPLWAARLVLAGTLFIAVGVLLVAGALVTHPRENLDVLCSGVTFAVAGGVLRGLGSPVEANLARRG